MATFPSTVSTRWNPQQKRDGHLQPCMWLTSDSVLAHLRGSPGDMSPAAKASGLHSLHCPASTQGRPAGPTRALPRLLLRVRLALRQHLTFPCWAGHNCRTRLLASFPASV